MLDRQLRPIKDAFLAKILPPFATTNPNTISMLAFTVGVLACLALLAQWYIIALFLWWFNRLLDGLDGAVARHFAKQSDLGGYLDILLDFALYAAIPISLVVTLATPVSWLLLAVLLSSFYLNAVSWLYLAGILEKRQQGAQAQGEQTSLSMPTGIIEGGETILFYSLFMIFPLWLPYLFGVMALLTFATVLQRWRWARSHLK